MSVALKKFLYCSSFNVWPDATYLPTIVMPQNLSLAAHAAGSGADDNYIFNALPKADWCRLLLRGTWESMVGHVHRYHTLTADADGMQGTVLEKAEGLQDGTPCITHWHGRCHIETDAFTMHIFFKINDGTQNLDKTAPGHRRCRIHRSFSSRTMIHIS